MLTAKIEQNDGDSFFIVLSGSINEEDSDFWEMQLPPAKTFSLDLSGVRAINSLGIREFINWTKKLEPYESINFHRCPKVFIDQVNLIPNLIPERTKIKSFLVPYFDPSTEEEKSVSFVEGVTYSVVDGQAKIQFPKVFSKENQPMEIDIIPERYFRFLAKHG